MSHSEDIKKAFNTAREAYQFLHSFHTRVRDTIDYFMRQFPEFKYQNSSPVYTDAPTFRSNPHQKWLRDLFPAHSYSMRYEAKNSAGDNTLFDVQFYCDNNVSEKRDSLSGTKDSKTTLELTVFVQKANNPDVNNWSSTWYKADYPENYEQVEYVDEQETLKAINIDLNLKTMVTEEGIKAEAKRVRTVLEQHWPGYL